MKKRVAAGESEMDRLSDLPEHVLLHIISFLPTEIAARTSLLSRRFCRLWEASPVLDLNIRAFLDGRCSYLVDVANRTILQRDPPSPLHRLSLNLFCYYEYDETALLTTCFISSVLRKATALGLRHLAVRLRDWNMVHRDMRLVILPLIFSIPSLESLSLHASGEFPYESRFPITLTHLKSLSIHTGKLHGDLLNYITSHLNALEDLHLELNSTVVDLKLVGVNRLKLVVDCYHLKLSIPALELFEFVGISYYIQWEMPVLKKAIIQLKGVCPIYVPATCEILKAVAHVEDLHLDIQEPAPLVYYRKYKGNHWKKKKIWRSKRPRNADGKNCRHAYFKDLHIDDKRKELIDRLIREIPKKQKA